MPSVKILPGEPPGIRVEGTEVRKPNDHDKSVFGIGSQDQLKSLLGNHLGRRPKMVYMEDELPWGDQSYGRYNIQPVRVLVRYTEGRILRLERSPVIVNRKTFTNNRPIDPENPDLTDEFGGDISRTVMDVMERNWNVGASVGFEQSIYYEVGGDAVGGKVGGSTTLSATASYGEGGRNEKSQALTSGSNVKVDLKRGGEQVTAALNVTKGVLVAEATIGAQLQGTFFVDMGMRYRGRFFHLVNVNRVKGMVVTSRETINVEQFSDDHVSLH